MLDTVNLDVNKQTKVQYIYTGSVFKKYVKTSQVRKIGFKRFRQLFAEKKKAVDV